MRRALLSLLLALPFTQPLAAGGGGTLVVKGQRFMAEVAVSEPEKAKGLMYRQSLAKDRCMIFLYGEDGQHPIWMKNCLISLDVAWVDAEGRITGLIPDIPPCSPMLGDNCPNYGADFLCRHFIEFPVGTFKRLGLKKGDKLGWDLQLDDGSVVKGGAPVPSEKAGGKAKKRK
jgi:uncharacterized membrane protein (UPF0127 family)